MKITVITLFPEMVRGFVDQSIIRRAQDNKFVTIDIVNLRDFATDNYGSVDGKPYGGGTGMVLRVDVLAAALKKSKKKNSKVFLTSAKGIPFNQKKVQELAQLKEIVIVAGHYEGVDDRILEMVDEEVSLGDFVMTGGEITAAAMIDPVVRLIPGVLKKEDATDIESFKEYKLDEVEKAVGFHEIFEVLRKQGVREIRLLEYPHFTRPEVFEDMKVPEVLLSGNHAEITKWRIRQAFAQTIQKRPDLFLTFAHKSI